MTDHSDDVPGATAIGTRTPIAAVAPRMGGATDVGPYVLSVYDAHHAQLADFVRSLERDRDLAQDIVSESFVRLIEAVRRGQIPDQPRAWLYRVAANQVIDAGRRRAVATRYLVRLVDRRTAEPPDDAILRDEAGREVRDALTALPPDARTALMLAAHGFTGRDIAETLGRSELATRSLLCRARLRLREQLATTEGTP